MSLRAVSLDRGAAGGQAIVMMVIALGALLAMLGLIIDGGNAFARQRANQNATDAAAEAGAAQLVRRLAQVPRPVAGWNATVYAAVQETLAANDITGPFTADYTDIDGNVLGPVSNDGGEPPLGAYGVRVGASQRHDTFVSRLVGISQITTSTEATAVGGYGQEAAGGGVIPVTFPVVMTTCDGSNDPDYGDTPWPPTPDTGPGTIVGIPLCSNGPGNVGWIDWTPTAGGASELADAITNPNNPPITTQKWYYVTATGNINSNQVQDALDTYADVDAEVLLPVFYANAGEPPGTCNSTPLNDQRDLTDCPDADRGGNGSNQWYYLVTFARFELQEAYINGGDGGRCDEFVGGNGATSCLIGRFMGPVAQADMTVGPATSYTEAWTPLAVQLIK